MRKTLLLFLAIGTSIVGRVRADTPTIVGRVVSENDIPAAGQTVNVVSSPQDSEGKRAKGRGITRSPDGDYIAPLSNVGHRVTGLWVTCMNDEAVAEPQYVVFPEPSKIVGVYSAKRLVLLPKNKSRFTKAEATETMKALATTYELQVGAKIIESPKAVERMGDECWSILLATEGGPSGAGQILRSVHDDVVSKVGKAGVLEEYMKRDPRVRKWHFGPDG